MKWQIARGQVLQITFADKCELLGELLEVHFDTKEYPDQIVVFNKADQDATVRGGADSCLFCTEITVDNKRKCDPEKTREELEQELAVATRRLTEAEDELWRLDHGGK